MGKFRSVVQKHKQTLFYEMVYNRYPFLLITLVHAASAYNLRNSNDIQNIPAIQTIIIIRFSHLQLETGTVFHLMLEILRLLILSNGN